MAQRRLFARAVAGAVLLLTCQAMAADQGASGKNTRPQKQVYGKELMTAQERAEHHARMKAARTPEERARIRREQHERMKIRAQERGLTLPDEPPAKRAGEGDHKRQGGDGRH